MDQSESCSVVSASLRLRGLYSPWDSPGQNTGVGSLPLLQGIFPSQGLNPGLLHGRWILNHLSHQRRRQDPLKRDKGSFDDITHVVYHLVHHLC